MKKRLILFAALMLAALAAGILFFQANYVTIGGDIYSKGVTSLDLSGRSAADLDRLSDLTALEQLDLRGTGITPEDYESLRASLPGCEILWSVPFQGGYYDQDTQQLRLTTLTEADMTLLDYLPQLKQIDASGCRDYENLMALRSQRPQCQITYQVEVGGILWDQDTAELTAEISSLSELSAALAYLPKLQSAEISGCQDYGQLAQLQSQYPSCQLRYPIFLNGQSLSLDTAEVTVHDGDCQELLEVLPYLPALSQVTFTGVQPDRQTIDQAIALRPDVTFIWDFEVLGVPASSQDTQLDLSGISMESCAAVEEMLKYFNQLETVDMCGCGIPNEEMDALNQRHPETLFVWEVKVGRIWLRTDATYFMPEKYHMAVDDEDCANLRYCTQLICLDLGHQEISDGSFMENMTKMEYLLIADTNIKDISFCANMPELKYLEMFMTKVKDLTPLLQCTKLEDLNIGYVPNVDPTPLHQMTQLKHLWASGPYIDNEDERALRASLPDTQLYFKSGSSTAGGWRSIPNYYKMRDILGMYYIKEA